LTAFALVVPPPCGAAPAAPAKHLEYAFADYQTTGTSAGAIGRFSGQGSGVLYVDFLRNAPDGGAIVQSKAWWWNELRSDQAVTCEVYPNGDVVCDQYPVIETVQFVLMPMLASNFFAGILAGPASRVTYGLKLPTNYYSWSCVANLRVLGWSGSVGQVDLKGTRREINGPKSVQIESATVSYDRERALPTLVHDELVPTEDSVNAGESVDLKLLREHP
jgi:hypothetical protein